MFYTANLVRLVRHDSQNAPFVQLCPLGGTGDAVRQLENATMKLRASRRRVRSGAFWIGVGLGAFVDGIGLHQIAQWHNMLSARIPPVTMDAMRLNMTADGWFHAAAWMCTAFGVWRLYAAGRASEAFPPAGWFGGVVLVGWGVFNLVEGIIDHHVLELHHVRDVPVHLPMWDWGFLLVAGVGFLALGLFLARD